MIVAGIQKNSLIDYPGKISCVLFLSGCNFYCPYCHNPELARGRYPQRIRPPELLPFLADRRQLIDGVVITGGEPTLHAGLPDLLGSIRQLGFAVKLDTNGSRPQMLGQLISSNLVDFIAMDIKTDLDGYGPSLCPPAEAEGIKASVRLIMESAPAYEFRTTCVRPFIDEHIIERIARAIAGARHYVLQSYHPAIILSPAFFKGAMPGYTAEQMSRLRKLAAVHVSACDIR